MKISRRQFLGSMTKGATTTIAAGVLSQESAHAEEERQVSTEAVAMLYDATRCVGCQTCVVACAQANHLARDIEADPIHRAPRDLSATAKSVIKLYKQPDGDSYSYVKQQCMHCVDPACAAACMFGALAKQPGTGIVTWNPKLCVGCRYCEIVCPYHVPKFAWLGFNPQIVKCEFCKERLTDGNEPACTAVCPTHAVIFGKRTSLLEEGRRRITANPGKYAQGRIFGESDGGGTQVLYLTHAPFDRIGLPKLENESIPAKYLRWQKRIYRYLIIPAVAYAGIVAIVRRNWKRHEAHEQEEKKNNDRRAER